jgi:uncharacterized protein
MLMGKKWFGHDDEGLYASFVAHGKHLGEAAAAFGALIANYDDEVQRIGHAKAVFQAEKAADRANRDVLAWLRSNKHVPLPREQVLELINAMDDIVDLLQDTTETLQLYDVRALTPEALRLGEITVRCCDRVRSAVDLLPQLAQPEVAEAAMKTCEEIDVLESDADRVMRAAMSALFREEPDVRELIKLKAVYEQLEEVSDRCEDVAKLIQTIMLRNT